MRTPGLSAELERRRVVAVRRLLEGFSVQEVADFVEVDPRTVRRWRLAFSELGRRGLSGRLGTGRPRKLDPTQEKIVERWLQEKPTDFGFDTELWTCRRLAQLIAEEWQIRFHPRYLPRWLRQRGLTPQKPQRVPRERDPEVIANWLATDWPRIKKKRPSAKPISF